MRTRDRESQNSRTSRFWVTRARALDALDDHLSSQLVIVKGPAGVGKSVLLHQLVERLEGRDDLRVRVIPPASLDESGAAAALASPAGEPQRRVVVLDRYADAAAPWLYTAVLEALQLDPGLTVVIGTRHRTALENPLVALDVDTRVLDPALLRMTVGEVADVMRRNDVRFDAQALSAFADAVYGWPALVQLAASHLRFEGAGLRTGTDARHLADTVTSAFTANLSRGLSPDEAQTAQLASVAPFLTASLAEAVGLPSSSTSPDVLRALQDAGLVWPSASRLLLAEPVRAHWRREVVETRPDDVARAEAAVIGRLRHDGDPLLAAQLAADGGDWATVAAILDESAAEMWVLGPDELAELLRRVPRNMRDTPSLLARLCELDPATYESPASLAVAERVALDNAGAGHAPRTTVRARVHLLRFAGRFGLAADEAAALLDHSGDDARSPARRHEAMTEAAAAQLLAGRTDEALRTIVEVCRSSPAGGRAVRAAGLHALVLALRGDVGEARDAVVPATDGGADEWLASPWGSAAHLAEALIALEESDGARALEHVAQWERRAHPEFWIVASTAAARAWLLLGKPAEALASLREFEARHRGMPESHYLTTHLIEARAAVLIALGQARKASALFRGPFAPSATTAAGAALSLLFIARDHETHVFTQRWLTHGGLAPRSELTCLVVNAVSALRLRNPDTARSSLQRAETLSRRTGLRLAWSALDAGDRDSLREFLSEDFRDTVAALPLQFDASLHVPRLTRSEYDLLRRLRPSATITTLAAEMVVSPNTVKTHLRNIYRKLGVSDRNAAIRAAHGWGLLDAPAAGSRPESAAS